MDTSQGQPCDVELAVVWAALLRAIEDAMWVTQEQHMALKGLLQETLTTLLGDAQIDEAAALAQVAQVMRFEQQFKQAHFGLLMDLKNLLDPWWDAVGTASDHAGPGPGESSRSALAIVPVGRGLQPQDARSRHEGFSEAGSRSRATLVETWLRVHQPDDGVGPPAAPPHRVEAPRLKRYEHE